MEIDPPAAGWRARLDRIRSTLMPSQAAAGLGQLQRARHVLEAHRNLTGMNETNAHKFEDVISLLGNELAEKERLAQQDKAK
jgi:hypothetical protein